MKLKKEGTLEIFGALFKVLYSPRIINLLGKKDLVCSQSFRPPFSFENSRIRMYNHKYIKPYDIVYTSFVGTIVYEDDRQVAVSVKDGKMV